MHTHTHTVCYGQALGMQLPPAFQSPFSFHLGYGYARKKKQKKNKKTRQYGNEALFLETSSIHIQLDNAR